MSEIGELIKSHWIDKKYNAIHYGTNLLEDIIGRKDFSYPKSLYTILDTLKIMTNKDDIVMDFFAGSGTTGHATLALNKEDNGNRKFILIEQLEDHIDICIERNKKVIKESNINDSIIYCELAKYNKKAAEIINGCKSLKELIDFFNKLYNKYYLEYNLNVSKFKNEIIHEDEFIKLDLDEQKKMFLSMLDLNQMYVPKSEMEDNTHIVSLVTL
jgi:adenine-specific DNA-methyltransferase